MYMYVFDRQKNICWMFYTVQLLNWGYKETDSGEKKYRNTDVIPDTGGISGTEVISGT